MIDWNQFERPFEDIFVLKKWNWNYLEAESFQKECVEYVRLNQKAVFLILCSHPHCFTLGRGLQKNKDTEKPLVDFHPDTTLPYPLYQINRGGGLTFHYPGQFVFYPIMNLTSFNLGVFDLMMKILSQVKIEIEAQFLMNGLTVKRDYLGLWFENDFGAAKVASIGVAASRFITYHGLALNFYDDDRMFKALQSFHPCGLPGDYYRSLETLNCARWTKEERERFSSSFLKSFLSNYLITERQRSSSAILDSISF